MSNDEVIKRVDKVMSLNEEFIKLRDEYAKMSIELLQLKAQLEKAESVIEFYADEMSYDLDTYYGITQELRFRCVLNKDLEVRSEVYSYAGKRAREYFANKESKKCTQ